MLSRTRILSEVIRVEKGHGAMNNNQIPKKNLSITCRVKLIRMTLPNVMFMLLIIWKNYTTDWGMATLWPAYHWQSSQPVASTTAYIRMRMEDTLSIKFKRFVWVDYSKVWCIIKLFIVLLFNVWFLHNSRKYLFITQSSGIHAYVLAKL